MIEKPLHIVLVDDDEEEYYLLTGLIQDSHRRGVLENSQLDWIATYEEGIAAYQDCRYDLFLLDYQLQGSTGLDFLCAAANSPCQAPIIFLTGQNSLDVDMAAMQLGASDFLTKSELSYPLLERSIRYALERKLVEKELFDLLQERTHDLHLLEKHARELSELHNATTSLLRVQDLDTLMGQILDSAQAAVPASDQSWLHLTYAPDSELQKLTSIEFTDPRVIKVNWDQNPEHPLLTVTQGEPLMVDDTEREMPDYYARQKETSLKPIRSFISAPLYMSGGSFGALSLGSTRPLAFEPSELQLLTSFANTATSAIHNAVLHAELESLATHDPLTEQLNRRALFDQGQKEVERFLRLKQPLSVIIFDIDFFKNINDTYGHDIGDEVLAAVVKRCAHVIRRVDILGRYGGDEFVVILPGAGPQMALNIAERIRTTMFEKPVETKIGQINVSISLGIAQATDETRNLSGLIRCADQALYQAKEEGRNCVRSSGLSYCEEE